MNRSSLTSAPSSRPLFRAALAVGVALVPCLVATTASATEASASIELGGGAAFGAHVSLGGDDPALEDAPAGDAPTPEREGWSPEHPFAIGGRTIVWLEGPFSPGVGAHARFRPLSFLGAEVFTEHFLSFGAEPARRDHVVGASLFVPLALSPSFFVAPIGGASVDLRVVEHRGQDELSPMFGVHGGGLAELYLVDGLAAHVSAEAYVNLAPSGSVVIQEDRTSVSAELAAIPSGNVSVGASYYF